jgi:predicted ester cyclase
MAAVDTSRATMQAYLEKLRARGAFAEYFTDDVVFEVVGSNQEVRGRKAVESIIRELHEEAFDGWPEVRSLITNGDRASLEAVFVGRHMGEFAGLQPTGRQVRVPYAVVYDLIDDRIKALRIYGFMDGLLAQLRE